LNIEKWKLGHPKAPPSRKGAPITLDDDEDGDEYDEPAPKGVRNKG
jgi:hypothetical protein